MRARGNHIKEFMNVVGIMIEAGPNSVVVLPPEDVEFESNTDVTVTTTSFDDFWELYDKRVGKQKCIKLWGKLTLSEQAECMKYIPLYKQAQPDKQFRKNPETFLRNKSWNDEIIIRNSSELQRSQRLAESASLVAKYTGAD